MKFTPEQVIEMAREAGFDVYDMKESPREAITRATRLCTLAADRALEAAALKCASIPEHEWEQPDGTRARSEPTASDFVDAIRAMKEQQ